MTLAKFIDGRKCMAARTIAMLLLATAGYTGWWAMSNDALFWLVPAGILLLASFGLALKRVWAMYLWYVIATTTVVWWVGMILRLLLTGWPFASAQQSIISLIPGLLLLGICIGGSIALHRQFKQVRRQSPQSGLIDGED